MRLMQAKTWEAENWQASSFQQPGESMHRLPPGPGNVELGPDRHGIAQLWLWGSLQTVMETDDAESLLHAALDAHLRPKRSL